MEQKSVPLQFNKLIFACCGGSDLGEIADKTARKLTKDGVGQMFCTAGLGGRVGKVMKTTESAEKILAIDGCPFNCTKNSLLNAGFNKFSHLQITDLGFVKGSSPATEENVNKAAAKAKEIFSA
jgi:uncharacterized metal-binding protein